MDKSIYDVEHEILADSESSSTFGTRTISFQIEVTDEVNQMFKGTLCRVGAVIEPARFLCLPNDEQNRKTLVDRARLTVDLKCPNVLAAKCVSLDSKAKKVILVHDYFEKYFEKPLSKRTKKPKPAFPKGHCRLDVSWRNIIRSALDGIHFLHENQLIHGALSEDDSYVMEGGSTCLVLPRESWADSNNEFTFTLAQWKDLSDFKFFLTRHLTVKEGAFPDWDSFLNMFSLTNMNASRLRKHPLIMDDIEVFYYFDATCCRLACADYTYHNLILSILKKMPNKWCVKGWNTYISKKSIAESLYKYAMVKKRKRDTESVKPSDPHLPEEKPSDQRLPEEKPSDPPLPEEKKKRKRDTEEYDPHSPEEMLRFILYMIHHAGQHARDHSLPMYAEEDIAAEITEMYPGYLSSLHEMWMKIPTDSISEYSYGSYLGRDANRR